MMGQPEVSGCHWSKFTSVGWVCNKAMKEWEAIVVTGSSTPIPTTFSVSMETVQDRGALSPVPCQTVSSSVSQPVAVMDQTVDRSSKYIVKYLVKNLVESAVSTGPSGVVCSTPLVGRRERKDVNPSILVSELIHSGRKELQGNDKLVERFVYKYFYKWMYQL